MTEYNILIYLFLCLLGRAIQNKGMDAVNVDVNMILGWHLARGLRSIQILPCLGHSSLRMPQRKCVCRIPWPAEHSAITLEWLLGLLSQTQSRASGSQPEFHKSSLICIYWNGFSGVETKKAESLVLTISTTISISHLDLTISCGENSLTSAKVWNIRTAEDRESVPMS